MFEMLEKSTGLDFGGVNRVAVQYDGGWTELGVFLGDRMWLLSMVKLYHIVVGGWS